jgi:Mrp family chromosome partitioning ATPase
VKGRHANEPMAREFRILRTRIEAEISPPAILLVASATARDGAGLTAFGLAESLSNSDQRTVLIATETMSTGSPGRIRNGLTQAPATPLKKGDGPFPVISFTAERLATMSRTNVAALMQRLRGEYDYVVVEAGDFPKNSFGVLVLSSADAALVTFRSGRSEAPADRTMIDTLERSKAKLLGVVMLDEAAIEEHARGREAEKPTEWSPYRKPSAAGERLNITLGRAEKTF